MEESFLQDLVLSVCILAAVQSLPLESEGFIQEAAEMNAIFDKKAHFWILSYYGAFLSGWLIYNSGGYWNAEHENHGATGWITMGKWIDDTDARVFTEADKKKMWMLYVNGCVSLSGEAGIGFFGALRTAGSIVMDHSVLGRIGLGCTVSKEGSEEVISLHDGLGMRFYHVPQRLKIQIDAGEIKEIRISDNEVTILADVWGCGRSQ